MKVMIVIDNLQIGGIQRLALDQFYRLRDLGFEVRLLVLSPIEKNYDGFMQKEKFFGTKEFQRTNFLNGKLIVKVKIVFNLLSNEKPDLIISHSVSFWSLFFRIFRLALKSPYKLTLTHHQFLLFSSKWELRRRVLYSLFADCLFGYSVEVVRQWEDYLRKRKFSKLLYRRKKMEALRNGVYLGRLSHQMNLHVNDPCVTRFVYVGRMVAWKGIARIESLLHIVQSQEACKVLIISPKIDVEFGNHLKDCVDFDFEFIEGETFASYKPRANDVHIFPVDYGESEYVESVSISCLEMSYLGIPTLLTEGGMKTWPELRDSNLFYEVDWNSKVSISSQYNLLRSDHSEGLNIPNYLGDLIDVRENLKRHLLEIDFDTSQIW